LARGGLALLNGAKNLEISNLCRGKELTNRILGRTLLVCDIEGSEYDLLNPIQTPALRKCDILVELHDHLAGGFTIESGKDELLRRLSSSHEVTKVSVAPRTASQLDTNLRAKLTAQELAECMDECRSPSQLWLWLKARS
jgi:hypothetical protein